MTHRYARIRPATTAIAAVLAFSSTALFAQAVDPVAGEAVAKPAAHKTTVTKAAAARPRPTTVPVTTTAPPAARAPVAAPVVEPAETVAAAPVPAVAATPPAQEAPAASNAMLPIAAAAGLGLVGLIDVSVAMRRRRRNEEEIAAADQVEPASEAPAEADPLFTEPAFTPRPAAQAPAASVAVSGIAGSASDCDEAAPGSHVEAACDGTTADNPSLSIKKRLKRAHFFDQREFLAEAGEVAPMPADAGLPDALAAPAPAPPVREPA